MKRITLIAVGLAVAAVAAAGARSGFSPEGVARSRQAAVRAARQAGDAVAGNPAPVVLGLGTFLLTVGYHKARGKTLRESVEVAATRVTVVPAVSSAVDAEAAVLRRAKARATRTQLIADQIGLENRHRKLPDAVRAAEQEACYAEKALADAERALAVAEETHEAATAKLDGLRAEKAAAAAESAAIKAELAKLADVV